MYPVLASHAGLSHDTISGGILVTGICSSQNVFSLDMLGYKHVLHRVQAGWSSILIF